MKIYPYVLYISWCVSYTIAYTYTTDFSFQMSVTVFE
jgi:uncharacterized membrane protein